MNYVHYTECVPINRKKYPAWAPRATTTLILASIPVLLASLLIPYVALIEIPLLIAYCLWWLYDRLICLGGDMCAIGLLGVVEPPGEKTGLDKFDTDFSINLVLAPHNIQELPADYPGSVPPPPPMANKEDYFDEQFKRALHRVIADDGIQGHLIHETSTTADGNWDFEGYFNKVSGATTLSHQQAYLHCEWEGGGIYKLLQALYVLLPVATAMAVVCSIPFIGWIACAVLAAVSAVIVLAGVVNALNDKGSPTVIDPNTGATTDQLHPGRDILLVRGTWVFDTAHEGWNEIHPIKGCWLVGTATYQTNDVVDWDAVIGDYLVSVGRWRPDLSKPGTKTFLQDSGRPSSQDWRDWVATWCDAVARASQKLTVDTQQQPEHGWETHPVIDGCRPARDIEPPPIH